MKTGDTGLNLIKGYEGLRMSAHYAPSEQWTVGYGHTDSARHGMSVTESDAERLLREDVAPIEALIADTVRAPLNQNEHDALTSLIFNIGEDNWRRSSVLRKLNEGDKLAAAQGFELWTKARVNGELATLDGLVRRRAAEKSLFLMPTDATLVVPTSDIRPAAECELDYVSDDELKASPLVDFDSIKDENAAALSPEEKARARAVRRNAGSFRRPDENDHLQSRRACRYGRHRGRFSVRHFGVFADRTRRALASRSGISGRRRGDRAQL
ncbi:MAG: lysozyme [Pseudomonadota bacterium]